MNLKLIHTELREKMEDMDFDLFYIPTAHMVLFKEFNIDIGLMDNDLIEQIEWGLINRLDNQMYFIDELNITT